MWRSVIVTILAAGRLWVVECRYVLGCTAMKTFVCGLAVLAASAFGAAATTVDLSEGATQGPEAVLFAEQSGVSVGDGDVTVDYLVDVNLGIGQSVTGVTNFSAGLELAAGVYDSFLIHFDPAGVPGATTQTFSFVGEIVAIILSNGAGRGNVADGVTPQLLNDSDAVFGSASVFETTLSRRSENTRGGGDAFTLVDANTLTASFRTNGNFVDNARVITSVAPVPVPASLPLLLAGLGGLALMRRRKA